MSSNRRSHEDSNDGDDFSVDEFDDFSNQLNRLSNEKQQAQQEQVLTIRSKNEELIEDFLLTYKSGNYFTEIKKIIQNKKESLTLDFNDIIGYSDQLADFLLREPELFIHNFKQVLYEIDKQQDLDYFKEEKYFNVRLTNYPIKEKIRKVDVNQRNKLLSMRGIISRTGDKKPYIWKYYLKCPNPDCGTEEYFDYLTKNCSACERRPTMLNDRNKNIYTNCMRIQIQELSEDLEGTTPQSLECNVLGDIIEEIKPGLKITMTGFIFLLEKIKSKGGRTPYYISVAVNNIEPFTSNDLNLIKKIYLTEKDEKRFTEMSRSPKWIDTLIGSFAPHIYGLQNVKLGILLSIVGSGNIKVEGTDIRSRIHILICGDPSLAKTKLLKFTNKVVLGSITATGKGASGGGLTAIVTKEPDGSFIVQPGAIVFANKSLFLFDESDKVREEVRDHLHESMEDGTVTVTKGGQIVTLQAETTTIFAANPQYSRYQDNLTLTENINLPHSLISRFDLIYVLKDNAQYDKEITAHINYIYQNRKIPNKEALLSIEDLNKYFLFVKAQDIDPDFDQDALDLLQEFYFGMRAKNTVDTIATTIRQYEGSLRMCRALARMCLSRRVTKNFAQRIINLVLSQFDSIMREADGTYNSSLIEGKSKNVLKDAALMRKIMAELEKEYEKHKIPIIEITRILVKEHEMTQKKVDEYIEKMIDQNVISNNGEGYVRLSKYA